METNINQGGKKKLNYTVADEDEVIFTRKTRVKSKISFELKNKIDTTIQSAEDDLKDQEEAKKQRGWITKDIQEKIDMRYAYYRNKVGELVKAIDNADQIKLAFNDTIFNQMNFKLVKFNARAGTCELKTNLTIPSIEEIEEEIRLNEEKLKADMERMKKQKENFKLKLEAMKKNKEEKAKIKEGTNRVQLLERTIDNA